MFIYKDIFYIILDYLEDEDIYKLEQCSMNIKNMLLCEKNHYFKKKLKIIYPNVQQLEDINTLNEENMNHYSLYKKLDSQYNTQRCMHCGKCLYLCVKIVCLITYPCNKNDLFLHKYHSTCSQIYRNPSRRSKHKVNTYICPYTNSNVFGFECVNV